MSRFAFGVVALFAFAGLMPAATTVNTAVKKKTPPPARPKTVVSSKATSKKPVAAKSARHYKAPVRRAAATRPSYAVPAQPSPERYQQIQQALIEKGYYKGEPNGQWGAESVDALKRFQGDQNLASDGKLNSLSLIALGLGPKRLNAQTTPVQPTTQPPIAAPTAPVTEPGVRQ